MTQQRVLQRTTFRSWGNVGSTAAPPIASSGFEGRRVKPLRGRFFRLTPFQYEASSYHDLKICSDRFLLRFRKQLDPMTTTTASSKTDFKVRDLSLADWGRKE